MTTVKNAILIVDDEPSIADNVNLSLVREGFCVVHCLDLASSRETLRLNKFDCIILDVGLPDGSGFDFCREIRLSSDVPIIMLTARADEIDRVVGLEIGADDYVSKPFSPRELVARVRAVLRRTQKEVKLTVPNEQNLQINEETLTVLLNGKNLELSAHEFRLLVALFKNPGRVFSRQQLLDKVWNDPLAAMERTVDAHVKSLRAKMREVCEKEFILTHRGFGYSFSRNL